jgi:2-dehydropantoate 2-reductase
MTGAIMQKINNIAILGAGAMGAAYASLFSDAGNFSVCFIARGSRYERLQNQPIVVNGKSYDVPVVHPDERGDVADLIIVALKQHHLADAIPDLTNFVGNQTIIMSVLNGLDSEAMIGAQFGMEKLLYTVAVGMDAVRQDGEVTFTTMGKLIFGEAENETLSDRVQRVQSALAQAGIVYETPVDMLKAMWWKFMVNVGVNQASAVMRAPYGVFQTNRDAQDLMVALMQEVIVLSEYEGIGLGETAVSDWIAVLNTLSPEGKTSMLQDVEAGRKTEVDIFAGKVVALGEKHGVPKPINQTMLQIIRVLE